MELRSKRGSYVRMSEQDEFTSAMNHLKEGKFLLEYLSGQRGSNSEYYELAAKDIGIIIEDLARRQR